MFFSLLYRKLNALTRLSARLLLTPLILEEERKKEGLLRHLGLEEGSSVWTAAMNGHQK